MSCHERLDPVLNVWGLSSLSFVNAEASPPPAQTSGPARLECWLKTNITITSIAGIFLSEYYYTIKQKNLLRKRSPERFFRLCGYSKSVRSSWNMK